MPAEDNGDIDCDENLGHYRRNGNGANYTSRDADFGEEYHDICDSSSRHKNYEHACIDEKLVLFVIIVLVALEGGYDDNGGEQQGPRKVARPSGRMNINADGGTEACTAQMIEIMALPMVETWQCGNDEANGAIDGNGGYQNDGYADIYFDIGGGIGEEGGCSM